jgi:hypothetical protein
MAYDQAESKVMETIRQLLHWAEQEDADPTEREMALRRANKLMVQHAIDQAELDTHRTAGEKRVPTQMRFKFVGSTDLAWEYLEHFRLVLSEIARTNRCRAVIHPGTYQYDVTVVGMREDVEWSQMLWMQVFLEFISKLSPKWEKNLSIGENVARLKEAGFKWKRIWAEGKAVDPQMDDLDEYDPQKARYLMQAYRAFLRTQEDRAPIGTQKFEAYRYSFVRSYVDTVSARLEQMRADAREMQDDAGKPGAVALLDVSDRIDDLFFELFPSLRPMTDEELAEARAKREAKEREEYEKDQAFLASLDPRERDKVLKARAAEYERQARADEKYWRRRQERMSRLHDDAGSRAGRAAGDAVNLNRSGPAVDINQRAEIGG